MNDSIRSPIVSGMFYPNQPAQLRSLLRNLLGDSADCSQSRLTSSMGLIAPHAGYVYSGAVAAKGYLEAASKGRPDVVVILGTSHTGTGPWFALSPHSKWETPLGRSTVNLDVMARLGDAGYVCDAGSFEREHSIEVQLPFIQYLWDVDMPIVPICIAPAQLAQVQEAANGLLNALGDLTALFVASSDFTHYEPASQARASDSLAIEHILALDVPGFHELCRSKRLSICGATAIEVLMSMALSAQWTTTQSINYATSGDVTGDMDAVVGYASVVMTKENYG